MIARLDNKYDETAWRRSQVQHLMYASVKDLTKDLQLPGKLPHWIMFKLIAVHAGITLAIPHPIAETTQEIQWTNKFIAFQRKFRLCHRESASDADREALQTAYPGIYMANLHWCDLDMTERRIMESWILTGLSDSEIAARLNISAAVIEAFGMIFFNIRDRLSDEQYMWAHVIGPLVRSRHSIRDYDVVWKLVGYFAGADDLCALMIAADKWQEPRPRVRMAVIDMVEAINDLRKPDMAQVREIVETFSRDIETLTWDTRDSVIAGETIEDPRQSDLTMSWLMKKELRKIRLELDSIYAQFMKDMQNEAPHDKW